MAPLLARRASTQCPDPWEAVREIRDAIMQPGMSAVLFFCSPSYDLGALGKAIQGAFPCPVIGCTSAGQIGPNGYQRGGMVAASLASGGLTAHSHLIAPLSQYRPRVDEAAAQVRARLSVLPAGTRAFGFLLVDGLARHEEGLAGTLYQSLGSLPMVGGSAGDDLRFEQTSVYWEGTFLSGAASLTLFETSHPFTAFKLQHFAPTDKKLVITAAEAYTRTVKEIDGRPAAEGYAAVLGLPLERLGPDVFSQNPLMLRIGNDYYVRSIQRVDEEGGLTFHCAIDEGLVLTVGQGLDPAATLDQGLRDAAAGVGSPSLVIGCDCVLRRLEFEQRGFAGRIGEILSSRQVIGFSTYGEQFNAVHVNQTFAGIALGA
jgi:hypothetical protein